MKNKAEQTAWFRYGVISSLSCRHDEICLKSKIQDLATRMWVMPNGMMDFISYSTVENWYYAYKRGGIDALMPKERKDKGLSREIPLEITDEIDRLLNQYGNLKTSNIIRFLSMQDSLREKMPGKSTVYRYVKRIRPMYSSDEKSRERLAFEAPYSGSLTQADLMFGPYIYKKTDGKYKKMQTYLIALIDDHSRLILHAEFFFSQRTEDFALVLKKACEKFGVPEKLYCDNGKIFLSSQIKRICAKLAVSQVFAKPRDPQSKGKIEKYFSYCRSSFLEMFRITGLPKTIEELNEKFQSWLLNDYNKKVHSTIRMTPMEKWLMSAHKVRTLTPERQHSLFLFHCERVVKKNGTFHLENRIYEISYTLASKKIQIEYNPFNPLEVYVSFEKKDYGRANILDVNLNNTLVRKKKETTV